MAPGFRENRKAARRWLRRSATVVFNTIEQPIDCTIFDISAGGARLSIAHPLSGIPHTFTLMLFNDGSLQRDCEVVWQDNRYVGVKFTSGWYSSIRSQSQSAVTSTADPSTKVNAG